MYLLKRKSLSLWVTKILKLHLTDAVKLKKDAKIGDLIEQYVEIKTFGRVAAQTAKQVIMQTT
jgi:N utilization substance protein A